jgi:hypothetical protein
MWLLQMFHQAAIQRPDTGHLHGQPQPAGKRGKLVNINVLLFLFAKQRGGWGVSL